MPARKKVLHTKPGSVMEAVIYPVTKTEYIVTEDILEWKKAVEVLFRSEKESHGPVGHNWQPFV